MSEGRRDAVGTESTVITDIGELVTNSEEWGTGLLGLRRNAALVVEDGTVAWIGETKHSPAADQRISADGRAVIPGFVDSHSHIVFGGNRADEFGARMSGQPYTSGGIMSTVEATRSATDDYLEVNAGVHLHEMMRQGTTTVEIKSGYGLTTEDEERSLRVAATLTEEVTYLGAHVVPTEYSGAVDRYVELVVGEMLDVCAPLARWVDVFVEDGAFGADEAREILSAGMAQGLLARVHANQLGPGPGVQVAAEMGAASADHCTHLSRADVEALATSGVVATLLPGAEFSTRSDYPDGRSLIDAGVTVAVATDCNPGSSYTSSMQLMIALAVRECHLTPEEALWAATAGGAAALLRTDVGRLAVGTRADLSILVAPSHVYIPYRPGVDQVATVMRDGVLVYTRGPATEASPRP